MRCVLTTATVIAIFVCVLSLSASPSEKTSKRKITCKTAANAPSCYWTRGRLSYGNGTPALRLWKAGTHHLLGIYSGPSVDRRSLDNENPELPFNIRRVLDPLNNRIWADFEVCPLERERPVAMQAACVESAKNIVAEKWLP